MARALRTEPAKTLGAEMWKAVDDHDEVELRKILDRLWKEMEKGYREHEEAFEQSDAHLDLGCIAIDARNALRGLFWDD